MRKVLPLILAFVALRVGAVAQPDSIFVCTDADGHRTYQNSDDGAGCRRVDGVVGTVPSNDSARESARRSASRPMISPASFPRVDLATQRLRDSDRRRILEDELRQEQDRLAQLRTDFNGGHPPPGRDEIAGSEHYLAHVQHLFEDIERSEANIASLRRELTPFRY